ncbi:MAG: hypothetical protein E7543_05890 [Ruminococcaceae bacterium]|nr:hypothetical protein [Oscillospiraceae bacterium]
MIFIKLKIFRSIFALIIISIAILSIIFSNDIAQHIKSGIDICLNTVIPSLYIFTILSLFIIKCDIFSNNFFSFFTKIITGFSGDIGIVYFLSLFCGYPVGARLINELFKNGRITKISAEKMLLFCVNPGPAFCITVIGLGCYGSIELGAVFLVSCIASSLIGIRIYHPKIRESASKKPSPQKYGEGLISAVNDANRSILSICGWVIISVAIIKSLSSFESLKFFLCTLEVTFGAQTASQYYSIYFVSFLLSFGGFSVHLQALSNAKDFRPSYLKLLLSRFVFGIISSIFTLIFIKLFKIEIPVSQLHILPSSNVENPLASLCLVILVVSSFIYIHSKLERLKNKIRG